MWTVSAVPTDNVAYTNDVAAYDNATTGDSISGEQVLASVGESAVLDNLSGTLTAQGARNLTAAAGAVTVNSVTFQGDSTGDAVWDAPGNHGLFDDFEEPAVTADLEDLLSGGMYSQSGRTDPTLTLTGLTSGEVYRVQIFHAESWETNSTIRYLGTGNNAVITNNPAYAITGEFTALGTNARVALAMSVQTAISAFQVRDTNVPPTTVTPAHQSHGGHGGYRQG